MPLWPTDGLLSVRRPLRRQVAVTEDAPGGKAWSFSGSHSGRRWWWCSRRSGRPGPGMRPAKWHGAMDASSPFQQGTPVPARLWGKVELPRNVPRASGGVPITARPVARLSTQNRHAQPLHLRWANLRPSRCRDVNICERDHRGLYVMVSPGSALGESDSTEHTPTLRRA